jgi:hypothetical protein
MQLQTIQSLHNSMAKDLAQCSCNFERGMVKAITGKEIRELAVSIAKVRKLTNFEHFVACSYGYKG